MHHQRFCSSNNFTDGYFLTQIDNFANSFPIWRFFSGQNFVLRRSGHTAWVVNLPPFFESLFSWLSLKVQQSCLLQLSETILCPFVIKMVLSGRVERCKVILNNLDHFNSHCNGMVTEWRILPTGADNVIEILLLKTNFNHKSSFIPSFHDSFVQLLNNVAWRGPKWSWLDEFSEMNTIFRN